MEDSNKEKERERENKDELEWIRERERDWKRGSERKDIIYLYVQAWGSEKHSFARGISTFFL